MKTGVGQSKYCIPFSRCLVSLCSSRFDFNSVMMVMMMKIVLFTLVHNIMRYNLVVNTDTRQSVSSVA